MAIKFKGDTTVAIINSIKKAEVDTVYRCFDSGVLLSNEVINHGDFVSWDGTKWIKRPDLSYLLDDTEHSIDSQIKDIQAVIPEGTTEENPLVNKSDISYTTVNASHNTDDDIAYVIPDKSFVIYTIDTSVLTFSRSVKFSCNGVTDSYIMVKWTGSRSTRLLNPEFNIEVDDGGVTTESEIPVFGPSVIKVSSRHAPWPDSILATTRGGSEPEPPTNFDEIELFSGDDYIVSSVVSSKYNDVYMINTVSLEGYTSILYHIISSNAVIICGFH